MLYLVTSAHSTKRQRAHIYPETYSSGCFFVFFFSVGNFKIKEIFDYFFLPTLHEVENVFLFYLYFFKKQTSSETRARVVERSGYSADVVHQLTPFLFQPALF
jgi:hypothetical protein